MILVQKWQFYVHVIISVMPSNRSAYENVFGCVIMMCTLKEQKQKEKIGVKDPSFSIQIPFFLKCSCTLVPRGLDHDIWQIIFKLVAFHQMIIGKRQTHTSFVLDGGGG